MKRNGIVEGIITGMLDLGCRNIKGSEDEDELLVGWASWRITCGAGPAISGFLANGRRCFSTWKAEG